MNEVERMRRKLARVEAVCVAHEDEDTQLYPFVIVQDLREALRDEDES